MTPGFVSSRRDVRHVLAPGRGSIEFKTADGAQPRSGRLKYLSISGLCCEIVIDEGAIEDGTLLGDCKLRLGSCTIRGDFTVRNRRSVAEGVVECGGLFYPTSARDEALLKECIESLARGDSLDASAGSSSSGGLFVRCGGCHGARWLTSPAEPLTCNCGTTITLGEFADVDLRDQLGELARQLGRQNQLDLPAAHSIVAGILTLEHALELGHGASLACRLVPEENDESRRHARFDPAFKNAVAAGFLSPIQAFERGRRESFARKIADRHHLAIEQAYAVADNRISLLSAIRGSRTPRIATLRPAAPTRRPRRGMSAAVAVVVLGLGAAIAWSHFREAERAKSAERETIPAVVPVEDRQVGTSTDRVAALRAATVVERNDLGQAVQAIGPDPHSVLLAFCESLAGTFSLEAVEVTSAYPPSADARLGVVRDLVTRGLFVVHIRKDPTSQRWYSGDGIEPLSPVAPAAAIRSKLTRR